MELKNPEIVCMFCWVFYNSKKQCPLRGKASLFLDKAFECSCIWLGTETGSIEISWKGFPVHQKWSTETLCFHMDVELFGWKICSPERTSIQVWQVTVQIRHSLLESYTFPALLSQVLIVRAGRECWSIVFALEGFFHHLMLLGAVLIFYRAGWREDFGVGQCPLGWDFNIVPML